MHNNLECGVQLIPHYISLDVTNYWVVIFSVFAVCILALVVINVWYWQYCSCWWCVFRSVLFLFTLCL